MTEPDVEKEALARKAQMIADALGGKANGHAVAAVSPADPALEAWADAYAKTEEGGRVLALINVVADSLLDSIIEHVVKPFKQRIAELEARRELQYTGTWDDQRIYNKGDFITYDGSMWACLEAHCGVRPGSSDTSWKLAVKRGKDGRDARK
jgi:hypothetical protein